MFYCLATSALHESLDYPDSTTTVVARVAEALLPCSIALWVLADSKQRGRPLPYDAGAFYFFAWPILTPIYLLTTRGWRAFQVFGWALLIYVTAIFLPFLLYYSYAALH